MNPKVEILKLYLGKKGQLVATFTAKVSFAIKGEGNDVSYETHYPKMVVIEGSKGTFVDVPTRKYKESQDPVPLYYLNKPLKDLIEDQALDAYEQAVLEKKLEQE